MSGGTTPYTYSWTGGGTSSTKSGLTAGTYTVTITDNKGCDTTSVFTITEPSALGVTTTKNNVNCNGGNDGSATANPTGGTTPYTYAWSPSGGTGQTATGLSSATYTVTVTDNKGCTKTATANVNQPSALAITGVTNTAVTCTGSNDGTATVTASNGTSPYTYSWSPSGGTGSIANGLSGGIYTVTVTDNKGCTKTATTTVNQSTGLLTAAINSLTNVTCTGNNDGTATATPTNGTAPFTYAWSPSGGTGATAVNLGPGTYTVTITDIYGCSKTASATINQSPALLTAAINSFTNVTCTGAGNGTATATGTNGTLPYTYAWNPSGGTNATAVNLGPGTYTVTITDNYGCSRTASTTINQSPALLTAAINSVTNVTCNGANDGNATVTASNGTVPYTYAWNPSGGTGSSAINLGPGTYTVTVTDNFGCSRTATASITQASGMLVASINNYTNVTCTGAGDGSATATPTNGQAPYTYAWSPSGGTGNIAGNLTPATYTVTITDNFGCSRTATTVINQSPALLAVNITGNKPVSCAAASDGSATVTATNGTAPYTYSWNTTPVQTGSVAGGLSGGTYTVTVTDAYGCSQTASTVILESPQMLTIAITDSVPVSCTGSANASATVTATNGTAPYTYSWNSTPVQTTPYAVGLSGGTYTVTVTDVYGCSKTTTVNLDESATPLLINITGTKPVSCTGAADGSTTVSTAGGQLPYTFSWNTTPVQTDSVVSGLSGGTYTVTVTDNYGCAKTASTQIQEAPQLLTITGATPTPVTCKGASDGTATVTHTGGQAPYTYYWTSTPPQTTPMAVGLPGGAYTVVVIDAYGCSRSAGITIGESAEPMGISISGYGPVTCTGSSDGSATVTVGGGQPPYTYSWNSVPPQTLPVAMGLNGGQYIVTVWDSYGCEMKDTVDIPESPLLLNTAINNMKPVSCTGASDGSATVTATNGTVPYTYTWSTSPVQNGPTAVGLSGGTYTVTVTDGYGCSKTATTLVPESPQLLTIAITGNNPVSCAGAGNGSATVTATNGTAPYTYSWSTSPVQNTGTAGNLSGGIYTVTVSDIYGCSQTTTVQIQESPQPLGITVDNVTPVTCTGSGDGSATVTPTGGTAPFTYSWNTSPVQTTNIANGMSGGIYTVTVTDNFGCSQTATVTINESTQLMALNIGGVKPVSCTGAGDGSATVTPAGGTQPYTYAWNTTPAQNAPIASNLGGGTYTVTVTDKNGCSKTLSVLLPESPSLLTINATGTDVSCNGDANGTGTVTPAGGTGPYTYSWNTVPAQTTSAVGGLTGGSYTVTVTDSYGCSRTAVITVNEPAPVVAGFVPTPDQGLSPLTVVFTNTSTGATQYKWLFGDGTGDTVVNPTHIYDGVGRYTVMLIAANASGCTDTVIYQFIVVKEKSELIIPNVFTPNGDGNNDIFPLIEKGLSEVRGVIYNRWGEFINKFDTVKGGWDGRTVAGVAVPDGVYYYVIEAVGSDGQTYKSHGFITLVR